MALSFPFDSAFNSALRLIRSASSSGGNSNSSVSPTTSPPATSKPKTFNFNAGPGQTLTSASGAAPIERQVIPQTSTSSSSGQKLDVTSKGGMNDKANGRRLSLQRLRSRSETTTSSSLASTSSGSSTNTATTGVSTVEGKKEKPLMSLSLAALLVYTIGVKWRGAYLSFW